MNDRFKELYNKVFAESMNMRWNIEDAEKFAELIIWECVSNLEVTSICFDGDVGRGIRTAARLTREHFGVDL